MQYLKQSVTLDPNNLTGGQALGKLYTALSVPYAVETLDQLKRLGTSIGRGHLSVLEHVDITLDCITNIETYKDFTRHRHCAFTIESTSFVKYIGLAVIVTKPNVILEDLEKSYLESLSLHGPKVARDLLPQCAAARMYITTNLREWRYIIGLRGDPNDNPLTNELRNLMWIELNKWSKVLFPMTESEIDANPRFAIPRLWGKQEYDICTLT